MKQIPGVSIHRLIYVHTMKAPLHVHPDDRQGTILIKTWFANNQRLFFQEKPN